MKIRKVLYFLLGLLLLVGGNGWALDAPGSGRESTERPPQEIIILYGNEYYALKIKDVSGVSRFMVRPDGTLVVLGTSGITRFMVNSADGSMVQYNSSGQSVFGVDAAGKPQQSWKAGVTFVKMGGGGYQGNAANVGAGNTSYNCTTQYDTYIFDTTGTSPSQGITASVNGRLVHTGVSIYLPPGNAALDGFQIKLVKWDRTVANTQFGNTEFCIVPASYLKGGLTDYIVDKTGTTATSGNAAYYTPAFSYKRVNENGESITYVYRWVPTMSGGTWYEVESGVSKTTGDIP